MEQTNITQIIIDTINTILGNLFSSIDNNLYSLLDDITFIDSSILSDKNFENILEEMGYTITIRANKISVCRPPYKRNIRIERNFGEEYSIKNIEDRILNSQVPKVPFPEIKTKSKRYFNRRK